jgi:hypothetical protein
MLDGCLAHAGSGGFKILSAGQVLFRRERHGIFNARLTASCGENNLSQDWFSVRKPTQEAVLAKDCGAAPRRELLGSMDKAK